MNRVLISSSLIAAFLLVGCDKPPAGGSAPTTAPTPSGDATKSSGTSSMGAPPSAASAASN